MNFEQQLLQFLQTSRTWQEMTEYFKESPQTISIALRQLERDGSLKVSVTYQTNQ